jgi:tRNA pseudouridine55 synthase
MKAHGLLFVDKSPGRTSHDVVEEARKLIRLRKIGHTGTLDPAASGLMVLCLGAAVRLQQFLTGMNKTYVGQVRFGFATTTYDAEGEPMGEPKAVPALRLAELNALAERFTGDIVQAPPPFSAKRFGGKRFYEMARAGLEVPKVEKRVKVMRFVFTAAEGDRASFEIECGSGTYIRSLAHELGERLGCGGHLFSLRREKIGDFSLERAITLEALKAIMPAERLQGGHFVTLSDIQLPIPTAVVDNLQARKLAHGQTVTQYDPDFPRASKGGHIQILNADRQFIGVGEVKTGEGGSIVIAPKVILAP